MSTFGVYLVIVGPAILSCIIGWGVVAIARRKMLGRCTFLKPMQLSFPRRRESSFAVARTVRNWIPAFAGMTD